MKSLFNQNELANLQLHEKSLCPKEKLLSTRSSDFSFCQNGSYNYLLQGKKCNLIEEFEQLLNFT